MPHDTKALDALLAAGFRSGFMAAAKLIAVNMRDFAEHEALEGRGDDVSAHILAAWCETLAASPPEATVLVVEPGETPAEAIARHRTGAPEVKPTQPAGVA